MEEEKHSSKVNPKKIVTNENSFGLLLFIFTGLLAKNISSVIHNDSKIRVDDNGSIATISEIIVKEEY